MITPYELLARFNKDGSIAGCHVRTITTVDGKDYESDPIPLKDATDPAFVAFATSFSASAVSERDALAIDKNELQSRLARLITELPFNPRLITIDAFLRRVEKETFQLAKTGKADPNIQGFLNILIQKANDSESVNLDSPRLSGALQYLLDKELLTENRVKEIMQDGTREESIED